MRHVVVVAYDIADPKRLRRVFKVMKGFGAPLQFSVFRCALTPANRVRMMERLSDEIHHREDQVVIVDLGSEGGREADAFTVLGRSLTVETRGPTIV